MTKEARMTKHECLIRHLGFIRLKKAPGFARGFSRHKSGVEWYLPMVCRRKNTGSAWRNGVRLCSRRNLTRDIQPPVRQGRVRPLMAFVTRGRSLESHWTPDLCLRKSCGAAAFGVRSCVCALRTDEPHLALVIPSSFRFRHSSFTLALAATAGIFFSVSSGFRLALPMQPLQHKKTV